MWSSTTAIQRVRAYLQRRHDSAHTLDNSILDLQLFFAAIDKPIHQVSCREIDGFIDRQHHQGLAPTTVNRRLYALRHFFDFLLEQQVVDANPIKPSHVLQRGRTLPRALAKEP
jgi:integrase/recombinase XerC